MKTGKAKVGGAVVLAAMVSACAGSQPNPVQGMSTAEGGPPTIASATTPADSLLDAAAPATASAAADAAKPGERPFASNSQEATAAIDAAIDSKGTGIRVCIDAARARRKNAHGKITVEIGIDEEGNLIGVKRAKGEPDDKELSACVRDALVGAPFPRSHAGVITVKKSFEDQAVYK